MLETSRRHEGLSPAVGETFTMRAYDCPRDKFETSVICGFSSCSPWWVLRDAELLESIQTVVASSRGIESLKLD